MASQPLTQEWVAYFDRRYGLVPVGSVDPDPDREVFWLGPGLAPGVVYRPSHCPPSSAAPLVEASGLQEIPPPRIARLLKTSSGRQARLWILAHSEGSLPGTEEASSDVAIDPAELFELAFALFAQGLRSSAAQATSRLRALWCRKPAA